MIGGRLPPRVPSEEDRRAFLADMQALNQDRIRAGFATPAERAAQAAADLEGRRRPPAGAGGWGAGALAALAAAAGLIALLAVALARG